MKKIGIVAGLVALALLVSLAGMGRGTPEVKAKPTDLLFLNPIIVSSLTTALPANCVGVTDYNFDTVADCDLTIPADLMVVANADGDGDNNVEPSDFADLDLDADQLLNEVPPAVLPATTTSLWVLVFVDDDDPVTIDPRTLAIDEDLAANGGDADGDYECGGDDTISDFDCDSNPATVGDGVVVATLRDSASTDGGDVVEVEAGQENIFVAGDVSVHGLPDEITLTALETTIQENGPTCTGLDLGDLLDEAADVSVAALLATIEDNTGAPLAGLFVGWGSDDTDVVDLNTSPTLTLDLPDGIFAVNLACGDGTGVTDVDATNISGLGDPETDSVEITVTGEPADVAVAVDPLAIVCDGVTGALVTATVTDSNGDPAVDGTPVTFSVVALGTADPITALTVDGIASSTVTPLSGITAGTTVIVSADGAQSSVLVECLAEPTPVPPPPPPPTAVPPDGITPPVTGTGGYLN